jgi:hypothetical protein
MPSKEKESVSNGSQSDDSYDEEDSSSGEELPTNLQMPTADRSNLLNYESDDSSDEQDEDSDQDILGNKALQK